MLDEAQLNRIQDPQARCSLLLLANLYEQALTDNDALRAENQRLHDEINRLKGEQGKPNIKANKPAPKESTDHSSEAHRKPASPWSKRKKNVTLVVDRTEVLPLDTATLPPDAQFKGYVPTLIQNLRLQTETVRFARAKYYSPSTGKTYLAPLPPGYEGGFGPDLKALVLRLHHVGNVSQPLLHTFLTHAGIQVSTGWLGDFLIGAQERFHQEKVEIGWAGLASSRWQQTDDTLTRVHGVNQHGHVVGNPLYTAYTTLPKKDRRAVLSVLHNGQPLPFVLTAHVLASEAVTNLSRKWQQELATWPLDTPHDEAAVVARLAAAGLPLSAPATKTLLDAMALAGYHAQTQVPVVDVLLSDDAPQFCGLTAAQALCWVHDARHYQKLTPHLPLYRTTLEAFQHEYWTYYDRLLAYREQPPPQARAALEADFDTLFATESGYGALDYRIQQTRANKAKLLQVLAHPELPLHNNASELAVRRRVRKRDVSFGPRSPAGVQAWDTFQTLAATAQKLGVSFLAYVADRVSERNALPSLAALITERAAQLNLDASWN